MSAASSSSSSSSNASFPAGVKTGFLVKRAVKSGGNWKKRFFVLSDTALTYFEDAGKARKGAAKGDILFTPDSTVSSRDVESIAHCFAIVTPDKTLYVAAGSEPEMADWIAAIQAKIAVAHLNRRGYLTKRAMVSGGNWKRTA